MKTKNIKLSRKRKKEEKENETPRNMKKKEKMYKKSTWTKCFIQVKKLTLNSPDK